MTDQSIITHAATRPLTHDVFLLDTNAYALLLQGNPADADARLRARLSRGSYVEAIISEISSLEIHSVLGRMARGRLGGLHACERQVEIDGKIVRCSHRWLQTEFKPLRPLELNRLRKAVRDAENAHGPLRLKIIGLESADIATGRGLLHSHAASWRFGSHDAVIAATATRLTGGNTCLVTSCKRRPNSAAGGGPIV